jgi:hypothetical protein
VRATTIITPTCIKALLQIPHKQKKKKSQARGPSTFPHNKRKKTCYVAQARASALPLPVLTYFQSTEDLLRGDDASIYQGAI